MVWQIIEFEISKASLDFTSSEQGNWNGHALRVGNDVVLNAIELLEYEHGCLQALVCEQCGITGCEPGNWTALRRLENSVAIAPAIDFIRDGDFEPEEYSPPKYMRRNGVPLLDRANYERLRIHVPAFRRIDRRFN